MANANKIICWGTMFFTIVLFGFGLLKYNSGAVKTAVYYFIGAIGFLIIYISYRKKAKDSQ